MVYDSSLKVLEFTKYIFNQFSLNLLLDYNLFDILKSIKNYRFSVKYVLLVHGFFNLRDIYKK